MRHLFFWIILLVNIPAWLQKCVGSETDSNRIPVAGIGEEYLYLDELSSMLPHNMQPQDSALLAAQAIEKWAKEVLMYRSAKSNILDNSDIEAMVEAYRRSLITYEYQQQAILEKARTTIPQEEIEAYYNTNKSHFLSSRNLVKGLLIKAPADSPTIGQLRGMYCKNDAENVEQLTLICLQKGIRIELFLDEWSSFDDVLDRIPIEVKDQKSFLRTKGNLDISDDNSHYLLYIDQYILTGQPEPLDYVHDRIRNILANNRKKQFIQAFENEMYENALSKGEIKYYE